MREPTVFGNWKMNKGPQETKKFTESLLRKVAKAGGVNIAVFPPFVSIPVAREVLQGSEIAYGAQDVSSESPGAFTGEVALEFLLELECKYVLVGHSERRKSGETDKSINKKLKRIAGSGITPVLCIGEQLTEREEGNTFSVIENQLKIGLDDIRPPFIIAYEPVWAIGTGRNATPAQASEVHAFIRQKLVEANYPGADIVVLYGGSVKPDNIDQLMAEIEIDGVLVGGASLKLDDFERIIKFQR